MDRDFRIGVWLVQPGLNCISDSAGAHHLEPKVMQVLVHLANHVNEVVSKEELMRVVWPDTFVTEDVLTRCISALRKALDDDPKEPKYIQTIPKSGYRLIAEVRSVIQQESLPAEPAVESTSRRRRLLVAVGAVVGFALLGALVVFRFWPRAVPSPAKMMLVVLPFQNLSGDPEQEYFSDGLTDEMITELARLQPESLSVIARTSAMQYKKTDKQVSQIGNELGVDYVVEGTVRREGSRVRITAQLIRAQRQIHIWAATYDRELSSILAVQTEVARAIAGQIRLTLAGGAGKAPAVRSVNPDAYVEYLMGRYHWDKLTPEDLEAAAGHFRRAVDLDPGFARAWLGLSDSYRHLGSWWGDWPPRKAFPLAKETVLKALDLDSTLGEAHGSLGWIYFVYDWDWAKAEAELKRGIELSPNGRDALSPYANFLRRMKRLDEARQQLARCLEVDPLSPLEVMESALLLIDAGEPQKAEPLVIRVSETAPDYRASLWGWANFYLSTGRLNQAISYLEKTAATTARDHLALPALGAAYARAGRGADARQVLDRLLATPEVAQAAIGQLYASMGEKEEAIRWWQKAYAERDPRMVWLRLYTADHPLWNDPRFQDLIRQMNFPQ